MKDLYTYKVKIVKIIDGDTVKCDIDLGMKIWLRKENIRLYGINAPELWGEDKEAGRKSKNHLTDMLTLDMPVYLVTHKDRTGKFGRFLGEFIVDTGEAGYYNVNDAMVRHRSAVEAGYGKPVRFSRFEKLPSK